MKRILVTPRSVTRDGHPSLAKLTNAGYEVITATPGIQPSEAELLRLLPGCAGYLAGVEPVNARVLAAATDLRIISRNGTGVDNIDLDAAAQHGIKIMRAQGANARGVAELTIGLLFSLARSIPYCDRYLKNGAWERRKGFELTGKTLGLIGFGKIGQMVGLMAVDLGMKVLVYDPFPNMDVAGIKIRFTDLAAIFTESDIISLHCPSQPGKNPVIDGNAVDKMKRGVYVINTARADLIDSQALIKGLESGLISGLATDVYEQEPPVNRELVNHERVTATPHIGGFTGESVDRAVNEAIDNLLEALPVLIERR